MKKIFAVLAAHAFSTCCFAAPVLSGNDIVSMCKGFDTGQAAVACSSYLYGFVTGDAVGEGATMSRVKGLKADWCGREAVTVDQEARAVYKWIVDNPAIADQPAALLMHSALKASFPCPSNQSDSSAM